MLRADTLFLLVTLLSETVIELDFSLKREIIFIFSSVVVISLQIAFPLSIFPLHALYLEWGKLEHTSIRGVCRRMHFFSPILFIYFFWCLIYFFSFISSLFEICYFSCISDIRFILFYYCVDGELRWTTFQVCSIIKKKFYYSLDMDAKIFFLGKKK